MKIVITIDTDNDAFQPNETSKENEVMRILRMLADDIFQHNIRSNPIYDINGNKVGEFKIEDSRENANKR